MAEEQSLNPWPVDPLPKEPLRSVLERLTSRYGTLKSLNKVSLAHDQQAEHDQDDNEDDKGETEKSGREKFWAQKKELSLLVNSARQELGIGLDFVSFLLSKDLPDQGKASMSAVLKAAVPVAGLGLDRWDMSHASAAASITPDDARKMHNVARGQRLRSLDVVVASLRDSAATLTDEVALEKKYWADVIAFRQRGWRVRRKAVGSSALAVQVGSVDAAASFRARGLALLHRHDDGSARLRLQAGDEFKPQQMRTRILRNGVVVGASTLAASPDTTGQLDEDISRLRTWLLDHELFYAILREARTLYLRNVFSTVDSVVFSSRPAEQSSSMPGATSKSALADGAGYEIAIGLVPLPASSARTSSPKLPLDEQADAIALLLRLLMTRTYSARFQQRCRLPSSVGDRLAQSDSPFLIRPLLATLHGLNMSSDRP